MYEARQNKEKAIRTLSFFHNHNSKQLIQLKKIKSKNISYSQNIISMQFLRKKVNDYDKIVRNKVVLYAEIADSPFPNNNQGVFITNKTSHAEELFLTDLNKLPMKQRLKPIKIYLSTSPCSSEYGTRKDDKIGCLEQLEQAVKNNGYNFTFYCDHLYQNLELREIECQEKFGSGFSSASAILNSSIKDQFYIHRIPTTHKDVGLQHTDMDVAQFTRPGGYIIHRQ